MSYLRYDDTELDEESLVRTRTELNETDEKRKECLKIFKKKLTEIGDLQPYLDETFLLAYLRVAKFDVIKASNRLLRFYEERRNAPNIFRDYLPSTVKHIQAARQIYVSPYRTKDNSALLIMKRGDYDPAKIPYDHIIRALSMVGDVVIQNPLNQMCGFVFVLDMSSSSWSGWSEYTPSRLKLLARLLQKTVAIKIRQIHVLNAPSIYYLIYSICYPLFSSKIRNRIIMHKNYDSLHSYLDPRILPEEYGGCLDQSDMINMFERLNKMEDFFETFSKYGYKTKQ